MSCVKMFPSFVYLIIAVCVCVLCNINEVLYINCTTTTAGGGAATQFKSET